MNLRVTLLAAVLLAVPAIAQYDVYDNGPTNGQTDAWQISSGSVVSDSFTFVNNGNCYPGPCGVNGLSFEAWLFPGDVLQSAEVSITSSEFGGTSYFDQIVNFTQSACTNNDIGFLVCNETGTFGNVSLNTGTYWLNLKNAVGITGDPLYWDENEGPSSASETSVGTVPSESFTLLGATTTYCWYCSTIPEPNSWLLLGSGMIAGLGAARRFLR